MPGRRPSAAMMALATGLLMTGTINALAQVSRSVISRGEVQIEVLDEGAGPLIVLLPSLGRGAEDFDLIAQRLAADGFRVLRPQPRGIGASRGPMSGINLHDYANDVAAAIEHAGAGPAFVVGHAFGNREIGRARVGKEWRRRGCQAQSQRRN